ncbi:MAG: rRNA adenine N-6-methyltransferase family protein, partial [Patescibacteria group bacterium]
MSKLDQLKSQLIAKGLWAQKGLGQNFLIDDKALDQIIEAADLYEGDHVVEVGSGTGFLTERLIQKAGKVTSVELD